MLHSTRIGPNVNDTPSVEDLKYIASWKAHLPRGRLVTVSYLQNLGAGEFERVVNQIIVECEREAEDMPLQAVKLKNYIPSRAAKKARKPRKKDAQAP